MDAYLSLLQQNGYLDGEKVAVVGAEESRATYEVGIEILKSMGVEIVLEAISDVGVGETEAEDAWWDVMGERVRASGATAVVFAGGDRAGFRGVHRAGLDVHLFPYNNESLTSLSTNVTEEMVVGAITMTGLTEQEQFDQPDVQERCIAPFAAANPDVEIGMPDTHVDGVEKWWRAIMTHCNQLRMFEIIATQAGRNLTHDSFREAAESLPQFKLPLAPYASLGQGKVDADDSARLSIYVEDTDDGHLETLTELMDTTP